MFRQTLHMARPAAAGVLGAAVLPFPSSFSPGARLTAAVPSVTDAALAAAASSAAGGARG